MLPLLALPGLTLKTDIYLCWRNLFASRLQPSSLWNEALWSGRVRVLGILTFPAENWWSWKLLRPGAIAGGDPRGVKAGRCVCVGTPCFGPFCVKFSALGERQQQSENWVMSWVFQQWMPQFVPDSQVINFVCCFLCATPAPFGSRHCARMSWMLRASSSWRVRFSGQDVKCCSWPAINAWGVHYWAIDVGTYGPEASRILYWNRDLFLRFPVFIACDAGGSVGWTWNWPHSVRLT